MTLYRRLRLLVLAALAVEFTVGMAGEIPPRREVFPFASWFLFARVPHHTVEYDVEFRAVDGRPLPAPVRFSRAAGWVFQPHSITAFNVIQLLGKTLERNQPADTRALRQQVDAFCGGNALHYDVVKVTYDPVARYETGTTLQHRVLGTFQTRQP